MKSLWKSLIHCMIVVGASTCSTVTLVADDAEQVGIVRIFKPTTAQAASNRVVQVNQSQFQSDGNVIPVGCDNASPGTTCDMGGGFCDGSCDSCRRGFGHRLRRGNWRHGGNNSWGCDQGFDGYGCPNGQCNNGHGCLSHDAMCDYLRCKFGYFIPTGGGGKGIPWVGHYSRVYPVNPYYSDSRDGQAYAAQGYGIPVSVPLAPVVGHTYEYGWGVPSSRLTPVSHPAY